MQSSKPRVSFTRKFASLHIRHKTIFVGLFLSTIGLFMPWYSDLDSFNTGVSYSALSGPASMLGVSMLVVNLLTLAYTSYFLKFDHDPEFLLSRSALEKWHGVANLYLSIVLISIYFDSSFGINVQEKSASFGLYVGVLGSIFGLLGGVFMKPPVAKTILERAHGMIEVTDEPLYGQSEMQQDLDEALDDLEVSPEMREVWKKQREIEVKLNERDFATAGRATNIASVDSTASPELIPNSDTDRGYGSYYIRD